MKILLVCCLVFVVISARPEDKSKTEKSKVEKLSEKHTEEKYTSKYDNVNIDEILKSDRLLKNYVNCLLEKGKCGPDGLDLKKHLPDALHNGCAKCSELQMANSRKIIHFLIDNKRDLWNELEAKYDKTGEYRKKYDAQIKKEKLKL
ncbi:unnamed protein product [Brassicogethes aeneus]|uniref:Uncharacterized protein n=1 Tax=Brassicogethes aeneus TaxID=1431903 RepID=A0A9P0FCV0_BRAAE|nr:unnamed protein product [Brassicogethes aeneus]